MEKQRQESDICNYQELPVILDVSDLQKVLKMSKPTIYSLMDQPSFGAFRVGRCKRVTRDSFLNWLKSRSAK
jgi:predicted DNA-binding transcriptional regulator AlpA